MNVSRLLQRFAFLSLIVLAGCATGPQISSDSDPQADFAGYRSYAFYSPLAVEPKGYSTPASNAMKSAVRREMEARGYVYDETAPDLLVNLNAYVNERQDVVSMPEVNYGYYYSYRANAYFAVPFWGERTSVHRYREGTLNVDLVDARAKRLVWEGVAVGRVARLKPADREQRINATIGEIFAQYPHRAGGR
jgi:hypothetical protein